VSKNNLLGGKNTPPIGKNTPFGTKTNKEEQIMKTTPNTFSAIIAVLAVIFTLAAFTACPTEETEPDYTFPTAEGGKLTIENQTGNPNAKYKDVAAKIIEGYSSPRSENATKIDTFINGGGTIKVILGKQSLPLGYEFTEGNKVLTITFDIEGLISNIPEPNLISAFGNMFSIAITSAQLARLDNSFTRAHIASLFKASRARA
jgi:hypothetical protein